MKSLAATLLNSRPDTAFLQKLQQQQLERQKRELPQQETHQQQMHVLQKHKKRRAENLDASTPAPNKRLTAEHTLSPPSTQTLSTARQQGNEHVPCLSVDRQRQPEKPLAFRFHRVPGGCMALLDEGEAQARELKAGADAQAARVAKKADTIFYESTLQQPAFDFIDQQPEAVQKQLKVFSVEREQGGRIFICATAARFWSHYEGMHPSSRHHYEIIRQGMPCHLYFDLEYDPRLNPHVDGDGLVDLLVLECAALMKELFNITLKPNDKVIELDSSGPNKWSRHVVIRQRCAFPHNGHVNAFVRALISRLQQWRQAEQEQVGVQQQQRLQQKQQQQQHQPPLAANTSAPLQDAGIEHSGLHSTPCKARFCDMWVLKEPGGMPHKAQQCNQQLQQDHHVVCDEQQRSQRQSDSCNKQLQRDHHVVCNEQHHTQHQPDAPRNEQQQQQQQQHPHIKHQTEQQCGGCHSGMDHSEQPFQQGYAHHDVWPLGITAGSGVMSRDQQGHGQRHGGLVHSAEGHGGLVHDAEGHGGLVHGAEGHGGLVHSAAGQGAMDQGLQLQGHTHQDSSPLNVVEGASTHRVQELQETLFIDLGVYTRNRAFRLCWSSKAGKEHKLRPTGRYATAHLLHGDHDLGSKQHASSKHTSSNSGDQTRGSKQHANNPASSDKQTGSRSDDQPKHQHHVFDEHLAHSCSGLALTSCLNQLQPSHQDKQQLDHHIQQHPGHHNQQQTDHHNQQQRDSLKRSRPPLASLKQAHSFGMPPTRAREMFLQSMVTNTSYCEGTRQLRMFEESEAAQHTGFIAWNTTGSSKAPVRAHSNTPTMRVKAGHAKHCGSLSGYGPSPLGSGLDTFVKEVCSAQGGVGASDFRTWVLSPENSTIMYTSRGTRWCANIGRQHKSNGVFWVIDLGTGTWTQRCFDPDCAGFRSNALPLLPDLWQCALAAMRNFISGLTKQPEQHQAQQVSTPNQNDEQAANVGGQPPIDLASMEIGVSAELCSKPASMQDDEAKAEAEYDELCCRGLELYEASRRQRS